MASATAAPTVTPSTSSEYVVSLFARSNRAANRPKADSHQKERRPKQSRKTKIAQALRHVVSADNQHPEANRRGEGQPEQEPRIRRINCLILESARQSANGAVRRACDNFEVRRDGLANCVKRKHSTPCDVIDAKFAQRLVLNRSRMAYSRRYQEINADYNRELDLVSVQGNFGRLIELTKGTEAELRRAPRPTKNSGWPRRSPGIQSRWRRWRSSRPQRDRLQ